MDPKNVRRVEVFASLQMAAEALIGRSASDANGQYVGAVAGDALERELVEGNEHASNSLLRLRKDSLASGPLSSNKPAPARASAPPCSSTRARTIPTVA